MRGTYDPPVLLEFPRHAGLTVEVPLVERHGGMANAVYEYHERRESSDTWLWKLHHIEEWMPSVPPQLRTFSEDNRLPMMRDGSYDPTLEAEQREREWQEWERAQGMVQ